MESKVKDFARMTVEEWLRLPTSLFDKVFAAPAQKAISAANGERKEGA